MLIGLMLFVRLLLEMKMKLSRTAEIVALSLFGLGKSSEVTFRTPSRVSSRVRQGLSELIEAGMVSVMDPDRLPKGAEGYQATERMGFPLRDFEHPNPDNPEEVFPIVHGEVGLDIITES